MSHLSTIAMKELIRGLSLRPVQRGDHGYRSTMNIETLAHRSVQGLQSKAKGSSVTKPGLLSCWKSRPLRPHDLREVHAGHTVEEALYSAKLPAWRPCGTERLNRRPQNDGGAPDSDGQTASFLQGDEEPVTLRSPTELQSSSLWNVTTG